MPLQENICWILRLQSALSTKNEGAASTEQAVNAARPGGIPIRAVSALKVLKSQLRGSFRDMVLMSITHITGQCFISHTHIHIDTHSDTQSGDNLVRTSYFLCVNLSSFFFFFFACCLHFHVHTCSARALCQWLGAGLQVARGVLSWLMLTKCTTCLHKSNGFHLLVRVILWACCLTDQDTTHSCSWEATLRSILRSWLELTIVPHPGVRKSNWYLI